MKTTYVMSINDVVMMNRARSGPNLVTYQEFSYWARRAQQIDPTAKVAVHFGNLVVDKPTGRILERA